MFQIVATIIIAGVYLLDPMDPMILCSRPSFDLLIFLKYVFLGVFFTLIYLFSEPHILLVLIGFYIWNIFLIIQFLMFVLYN